MCFNIHGPVAIFGWFHGLSLGMFPENLRSFGSSSWCRCGTGNVAFHSERSMGTGPSTDWGWKCLIKTPGIRLKELQNLEGRDFRYILPCLSFPPLWRFIHSQYFCWCNSLTSFSSKLMQKMLLSSFNITWDLRRATKNKLYENMLILDGLRWVDIVWQM